MIIKIELKEKTKNESLTCKQTLLMKQNKKVSDIIIKLANI